MAIGKLAAEFSAGDKGLQDQLANIEGALKSSGLSASAFAKRFNDGMDSAEKSAGTLMPVVEKLQTKIAILKTALKFETDPKAVMAMSRELQALDMQMLHMTGKTIRAHKLETHELEMGYRQSASALFALSMVMGVFSSSAGTATGKTKVLKDSLDKGIQSALGMSFGLMMLGPRFASLVGPVGIGIGLIMALVTALRSSNAEAEKAAEEGVKAFGESFTKLSMNSRQSLLSQMADRRKNIEDQRNALTERTTMATREGLITRTRTRPGSEERVKALTEEDSRLERLLDKYKDQIEEEKTIAEYRKIAADALLHSESRILVITEKERRLKEILATGMSGGQFPGALTAEGYKQYADELLALTRERDDLMKTSEQRAKESIDLAKAEYDLGLLSYESYLNVLKAKRSTFALTKDQLAIDKEIQDVYAKRAAYEEAAYQTAENKIVKGYEARKKLDEIAQQANIDAISDRWAKERAAALADHTKRLQLIQDEGYASGNIDNATLAAAAEGRRYAIETGRITRDQQTAMFDDILQGASSVASALQSAFGGAGDNMIAKMGQALQVALNIARAIQAANAPGAGAGAGLGILGAFINIFSLGFARGGYTGGGARNQIAGVAHAGEVVFEKPLVDVYGGMLMALRSSLQRGYASGGMVGGMLPPSARGEIRIIGGKVDVSNGEIALRAWMPGYETWNQKKRP